MNLFVFALFLVQASILLEGTWKIKVFFKKTPHKNIILLHHYILLVLNKAAEDTH